VQLVTKNSAQLPSVRYCLTSERKYLLAGSFKAKFPIKVFSKDIFEKNGSFEKVFVKNWNFKNIFG
jgi:hypothetical protein